jgi:hypothetical protein
MVPLTTDLGVLWAPESMQHAMRGGGGELGSWSYVIVEEIVDAVAVLSRWPWPMVDQTGGLFWDHEDEYDRLEAVVPVRVLHEKLYQNNEVARRPRPGDAFATRQVGTGWGSGAVTEDLSSLLPEDIYDISADAYEAVRIAYLSAVAAVFPAEDDSVLPVLRDLGRQRHDRAAPRLNITYSTAPSDQS